MRRTIREILAAALVAALGLAACSREGHHPPNPTAAENSFSVAPITPIPRAWSTTFAQGVATSSYAPGGISTVLRAPGNGPVLVTLDWNNAAASFTWAVPNVGTHTGVSTGTSPVTPLGSNYAAYLIHLRVQDALTAGKRDQPGCDGVPDEIEGLCLSECCEIHDACYAQWDCTAWSWLPYVGSAQCDECNDDVVDCFARCFSPYGEGP